MKYITKEEYYKVNGRAVKLILQQGLAIDAFIFDSGSKSFKRAVNYCVDIFNPDYEVEKISPDEYEKLIKHEENK
jgi:hypothetical protein